MAMTGPTATTRATTTTKTAMTTTAATAVNDKAKTNRYNPKKARKAEQFFPEETTKTEF